MTHIKKKVSKLQANNFVTRWHSYCPRNKNSLGSIHVNVLCTPFVVMVEFMACVKAPDKTQLKSETVKFRWKSTRMTHSLDKIEKVTRRKKGSP